MERFGILAPIMCRVRTLTPFLSLTRLTVNVDVMNVRLYSDSSRLSYLVAAERKAENDAWPCRAVCSLR